MAKRKKVAKPRKLAKAKKLEKKQTLQLALQAVGNIGKVGM